MTGQTSSSIRRRQILITFSLGRCELLCSLGTVNINIKFEIFFSWSYNIVMFTPEFEKKQQISWTLYMHGSSLKVATLKWQFVFIPREFKEMMVSFFILIFFIFSSFSSYSILKPIVLIFFFFLFLSIKYHIRCLENILLSQNIQ